MKWPTFMLSKRCFQFVDELATIFEIFPGIFEGNANNEPTSNIMEMPIENDEAIGVKIVGLQETC
jgi:hypothetical protein